jgi:hypothetical protein
VRRDIWGVMIFLFFLILETLLISIRRCSFSSMSTPTIF